MNNEIKAWVECCDDATALRVLRQTIDERLADMQYAEDQGGVPPQAVLRRTEPVQSGARAQPMTGPSPAPFYTDQLRAQAQQATLDAARKSLNQSGAVQRSRAEEIAREEKQASHGAEAKAAEAREKESESREAKEEAEQERERQEQAREQAREEERRQQQAQRQAQPRPPVTQPARPQPR